jgi:hypothetical protein
LAYDASPEVSLIDLASLTPGSLLRVTITHSLRLGVRRIGGATAETPSKTTWCFNADLNISNNIVGLPTINPEIWIGWLPAAGRTPLNVAVSSWQADNVSFKVLSKMGIVSKSLVHPNIFHHSHSPRTIELPIGNQPGCSVP